MAFSHTNSKGNTYILNKKDVTLKGGQKRTIYFFAKDERPGAPELPEGYTVVESSRTGLPMLKKK
jgi:hypothetical protein